MAPSRPAPPSWEVPLRLQTMKILITAILAFLGLLLVAVLVASWLVAPPLFDDTLADDPLSAVTIHPTSEALTFARTRTAAGAIAMLVVGADVDGVTAVNISDHLGEPVTDPLQALATFGRDAIAAVAESPETVEVAWETLTLPFDPAYPHVAAGTNFKAHAEEAGIEGGPFLFPKLSRPTPWNAQVGQRGRLDFEAELCAVTVSPHSAAEPADLGYVLCNDFTDRWALVREIDLEAPMGTTGFPMGKGGDGMLPIGPLLVVPARADVFYREVRLALYVNGRKRQDAPAALMIWPPREILDRALAACANAYETPEGSIGLTTCGGLPRGTLLLTGTPAGVAFHLLNLWRPGAYLEAGDEVITTGSGLGILRNRIE